MSVASAIPTVARDFVGLPNSAGSQHDRFRAKNSKMPAFSIVTECAHYAFAILEQGENANLHVHVEPAMDTVILQCPDHFQTGAITDMRQPWVFVSAEISLQDPPVVGAIK